MGERELIGGGMALEEPGEFQGGRLRASDFP